MIPSRHTIPGTLFFSFYAKYQLKHHFRDIRFELDLRDQKLPTLIIANHFTWWDGFIQLYLNDFYLHRKFHVMMLEEQLRKHRILRTAGAFSVSKGTRNVMESIEYCVRILEKPENLLLFFPQGEIQSLHTNIFQFERGLEILLNRIKNPIQLIFNVNLVDYFSHKKPGLFIYAKNYPCEIPVKLAQIEKDFNAYAHQCMNNQKES